VPPIAANTDAVCFVSVTARDLPASRRHMSLLGRLALLVVEDLRLQHLAEAHAVAVLRDVDVEVALDMLPHNLRPLPRLHDS